LDLEREKNRQLQDLLDRLSHEAVLANSLALCGHQAVAYNALERYGQVSKAAMFDVVYRNDESPPVESELRSLICALRKKLPDNEQIVTIWGWGWRFQREVTDVRSHHHHGSSTKKTKKPPKPKPQPIHTLGLGSARQAQVSSLSMM